MEEYYLPNDSMTENSQGCNYGKLEDSKLIKTIKVLMNKFNVWMEPNWLIKCSSFLVLTTFFMETYLLNCLFLTTTHTFTNWTGKLFSWCDTL